VPFDPENNIMTLRRVVLMVPDGLGQAVRTQTYRLVHEANEAPKLVGALLWGMKLRETSKTVSLKVAYPERTSELSLPVNCVGGAINGGGDVASDGLHYRAFSLADPVLDNEKPDNEKPVPRLTFHEPPYTRGQQETDITVTCKSEQKLAFKQGKKGTSLPMNFEAGNGNVMLVDLRKNQSHGVARRIASITVSDSEAERMHLKLGVEGEDLRNFKEGLSPSIPALAVLYPNRGPGNFCIEYDIKMVNPNYSPPSPRTEDKKRKRVDATRRELANMMGDLGTYWYGFGL
jgi:hypothetical protein